MGQDRLYDQPPFMTWELICEALADDDFDALKALLAPDCKFYLNDNSAMSREQLVAFFRGMRSALQGLYENHEVGEVEKVQGEPSSRCLKIPSSQRVVHQGELELPEGTYTATGKSTILVVEETITVDDAEKVAEWRYVFNPDVFRKTER